MPHHLLALQKVKQDNKETFEQKIEEEKETFEDQIETENLHRKSPGKTKKRLDIHHPKPLQEHQKVKVFIYKHKIYNS